MGWDDFRILNKESNPQKRLYLESFQIATKTNAMNNQTDHKSCNAIYKNVLNKFK